MQLTSILLPALAGGDINSCGGFDISALHGTPEKLLYKFQYLRVEAEAVDLYKIADEVIPEVVEENNITVAEISKTDLDKHMAADGAHPNNEGHAIMAGVIFDSIDFSKLS